MKKIMKYISKDRQKEQVVEKLCQRFRYGYTTIATTRMIAEL